MTSKVSRTVLKLNDLTKADEIKWKLWTIPIDSLSGMERLIGNPYVTVVSDKKFRIYKYEFRHYTDEDNWDWVPRCRLEFIDENGKGGWQFPDDERIVDLMETVLFKVSGASDFFDNFLADE
ncbi:hypothetical protein [Psychroserpens sp. Hel_I_66]|uniref:hypothetical protein n=1 Tax=Psychroserpens sp. Hel_I_66 TaxID=1250004 RepID=UPI000645F3AA|nr:hypothetical protein [Psychroserpens sp. Hel_I_66]